MKEANHISNIKNIHLMDSKYIRIVVNKNEKTKKLNPYI
jgi:hypothetical protein